MTLISRRDRSEVAQRPVGPLTGPRGGTPTRRRRRSLLPWVFLTPALLFFAVFKFWPMARGIYLSFFDVQPYLGNQWIGTDNFERALQDSALQSALWHTVLNVAVVVPAAALIGLGVALLIGGAARSLRVVRTAVFLPVVTAVAVVAEVWRIVLYPTGTGLLNSLIGLVGVDAQPFLTSPDQALPAVMLMQVWKQAPYDMAIFVAGLTVIDRHLYEAAAVDGANAWQRFRAVTLPGLRPAILIILVLGLIRGMRVFTEIYALTGGGPAGSTEVIMTYIYKAGIQNSDLGYASAVSSVLFVLTASLTVGQLWLLRRKDREA